MGGGLQPQSPLVLDLIGTWLGLGLGGLGTKGLGTGLDKNMDTQLLKLIMFFLNITWWPASCTPSCCPPVIFMLDG